MQGSRGQVRWFLAICQNPRSAGRESSAPQKIFANVKR